MEAFHIYLNINLDLDATAFPPPCYVKLGQTLSYSCPSTKEPSVE